MDLVISGKATYCYLLTPTGEVEVDLVISGKALESALQETLGRRDNFATLAMRASCVICCRASPAQKAAMVGLVKERGKVVLAIGDGGNDVSMIQEAHVGIGIHGNEGLQAVLISSVHRY